MTGRSSKRKKNKRGGAREGTPGASGAVPASSHAAGEEDTKPVDIEVVVEEVKAMEMEEKQVRTEEEDSTPIDKGAAAVSQSSQSSASSPSRGSWRSVMTRGKDATLKDDFIEFIKTYKYPGHNSPSFKSQVLYMAKGGGSKLEIRFDHLLDGYRQNQKLLDLCVKIGNTDRSTWITWLTVTISDLLEKDWIEDRGTFDLTRQVEIEFLNKPFSVTPFKTLLNDANRPNAKWIKVLAGRRNVYAATSHGKFPFKAAVASLLSQFRQDRCFEGRFNIEEFFLMNNQICYICKTPITMSSLALHPDASKKFMAERKVKNVKSLWKMFEPYYIDGKYLPMYFETLKIDLTSVTTDMITEDWYLVYLERHFTWGSSMCRKTFTYDSQQVNKVFDFGCGVAGSYVMSMKPAGDDWREAVWKSKDNLLNGVYWHNIRLEDYGLQGIATHIDRGEYDKISCAEYKMVRPNTIGGLLGYKRNLIQHLKDHLDREAEKDKGKGKSKAEKYKINDFDELELFASSSLWARPEPTVLKHLVKNHPKEFESLMSFYKAGLSDTKDLPHS